MEIKKRIYGFRPKALDWGVLPVLLSAWFWAHDAEEKPISVRISHCIKWRLAFFKFIFCHEDSGHENSPQEKWVLGSLLWLWLQTWWYWWGPSSLEGHQLGDFLGFDVNKSMNLLGLLITNGTTAGFHTDTIPLFPAFPAFMSTIIEKNLFCES